MLEPESQMFPSPHSVSLARERLLPLREIHSDLGVIASKMALNTKNGPGRKKSCSFFCNIGGK